MVRREGVENEENNDRTSRRKERGDRVVTQGRQTDAEVEAQRSRATAWFAELRDQVFAALEELEETLPAGAPLHDWAPGRHVRTPWTREGGGGGEMGMLRGRLVVEA